MTTTTEPTTHVPDPVTIAVHRLRGRCGDVDVFLPGEPEYDEAARPWNLAVAQRPAAVAVPRTAEQAAQLVGAAAHLGLRIAPQGTGHAAGALANHDLGDVVLVRTTALRSVEVDLDAQVVRAGGGAEWKDVLARTLPYGLVALHGSSPDVGVVGYALGGGMGWYARKLGLAATSVTAVELVLATGELVRVDADHRPDLFWAVRGGNAANFGLVTAVELRLFPVGDAYAGMMLWDISRLEPVLRTWVRWAAEAPDRVTTALRVMRYPDLPHLPPFLAGRSVLLLDGAVLGTDEDGERLVRAFRDLSPELDTFGRVPAQAVTTMHMDPDGPAPGVGDGMVLEAFDEAGIEAFLEAAGAGSPTRLLAVELRQLGGAVGRPAPGGGALDHVPGGYALFALGAAPVPAMVDGIRRDLSRLLRDLAPWQSRSSYLNLTERSVDPESAYPAEVAARLRAVRTAVDPNAVFLANHPVD